MFCSLWVFQQWSCNSDVITNIYKYQYFDQLQSQWFVAMKVKRPHLLFYLYLASDFSRFFHEDKKSWILPFFLSIWKFLTLKRNSFWFNLSFHFCVFGRLLILRELFTRRKVNKMCSMNLNNVFCPQPNLGVLLQWHG